MNSVSSKLNNASSVASDRTMRTACSAFLFAVRFFAYCFFYYFNYLKSTEYQKRMRAFEA